MFNNKLIPQVIKWLLSRIAVIYVILFLFSLVCIDFKMVNMRIKTRHLNDAIPNFSDLIIFSRDQGVKRNIDLMPYKHYFELIMKYIPNDLVSRQLLGYVDYYVGQESTAIDLLKSSSVMTGHGLFWSNYNLGVIYFKKGMWSQAADYLFKAVNSSTQLQVLMMKDALVYKQIFVSPYFVYSIDDEILDAQSHAYILLLSSLYKMGAYDKMIMIANLALSKPNLSYKDAYYYYAGLGFYQMGDLKKAFLFFQKSISLEKNNPDVYYFMGNIYQNIGQLDQAKEFLQVSYALHIKNDPRFPYEKNVSLRFF